MSPVSHRRDRRVLTETDRVTRLTLRVGGGAAGQRLDAVLNAWLPGAAGRALSRSLVRRLIVAGAVRVDGRACRLPATAVRAGAQLGVELRSGRLPPAQRPEPHAVVVLYEDEHLLAVDKPPGLPTVATADPGRSHLVGLTTAWLRQHRGPAPVTLGVHQRLDRDTSGVVLFARTPLGNRALARAFADGLVEKDYVALVAAEQPGAVPPAWEEAAALEVSGRGRRGRVRASEGGVPARTTFRVEARFNQGLRVAARPQTGRKHQVRAHLAARGLPILGDVVYGGPDHVSGETVPRVMLHARRLTVPHPVTGDVLHIDAPLPADFAACEARLRRGRGPRP